MSSTRGAICRFAAALSCSLCKPGFRSSGKIAKCSIFLDGPCLRVLRYLLLFKPYQTGCRASSRNKMLLFYVRSLDILIIWALQWFRAKSPLWGHDTRHLVVSSCVRAVRVHRTFSSVSRRVLHCCVWHDQQRREMRDGRLLEIGLGRVKRFLTTCTTYCYCYGIVVSTSGQGPDSYVHSECPIETSATDRA